MKKKALVTGASSGIGRATALALIDAGYTVYGTSRTPESADPALSGIRFFQLELTDTASIDRLTAQLPTLDLVVCSAASSLMSAVEDTPIEKIRAHFELIVFGNLRLIQNILPGMRAAGEGLIVNIGSFAERTPVPCAAVYAGAKAAMHILCNGLRQELRRFGIRVVTVAPTFVKTPIRQERLCPDNGSYGDMIRAAGAVRDRNIEAGGTPEAVARKILGITRKKNPRSFYPAGKSARLLSLMHALVPEAAREAVIRSRFGL